MLFSLKNSYLYVQNVKNYHWMVFQTPKVSFSRTQCSVLADEECFRWYTGGSPLRVDINYDIWCRESGRECWLEHRLWILQFPHQLAPAPDRNHWYPDVNVQCHTNKEYFSYKQFEFQVANLLKVDFSITIPIPTLLTEFTLQLFSDNDVPIYCFLATYSYLT